jgi:hypothetical protein
MRKGRRRSGSLPSLLAFRLASLASQRSNPDLLIRTQICEIHPGERSQETALKRLDTFPAKTILQGGGRPHMR